MIFIQKEQKKQKTDSCQSNFSAHLKIFVDQVNSMCLVPPSIQEYALKVQIASCQVV